MYLEALPAQEAVTVPEAAPDITVEAQEATQAGRILRQRSQQTRHRLRRLHPLLCQYRLQLRRSPANPIRSQGNAAAEQGEQAMPFIRGEDGKEGWEVIKAETAARAEGEKGHC